MGRRWVQLNSIGCHGTSEVQAEWTRARGLWEALEGGRGLEDFSLPLIELSPARHRSASLRASFSALRPFSTCIPTRPTIHHGQAPNPGRTYFISFPNRTMAFTPTAAIRSMTESFLARFSASKGPLALENYIDGQFRASQASHFIDVHDPATQQVVSRTPQSTPQELRAAADSAQAAFLQWRNSSLLARQQILTNYSRLLREHQSDIANVIVRENGKTHPDAMGDVLRGIQVVEHAAGVPQLLKGDLLEVSRDMDTYSRRAPLGVGAAICAFNFPAMIPLWSIPMAISTGNTLLLKPSERVPSAALVLAELATQAGVPDGVLNVVHGGPDTVNFLCDEPLVKNVTFVGGDKAGQHIWTRAGANGKRVQANMGAKNHAVLLPDANKNHALNALAGAAFGAAGQRCMAVSVLVTVGATDAWLPDLVDRAQRLNVNQGFAQGADLGPLISPAAKQRVERLIASAEQEGGKILLDGRGYKVDGYPDGNWVGPTVIEATTDMTCYKEEVRPRKSSVAVPKASPV